MKYRKLGNTDMDVSVLSFGASALGSVFRATDYEESVRVVHQAIECGINLIDTAPWYGHGKSETVLGKALKTIPRDKYFLTTKVGRYLPEVSEMIDFSAERTLKSVDESLERLGVDYVDVIQVHDMEFAENLDVIINETLPALQKVKESGKARYIGITGYPLDNFRTVIEKSHVKIDTILSYCHYTMNDTSLAEHLEFFKSKGVGVINASPISMGLLSARGPPEWHPATQNIKDACKQAAGYCSEKDIDLSKLAVKFTTENENIPTTLVSTASERNLKTNINVVESELTVEERDAMEHILDRYMVPLKNATWENLEVQEYRRQLAARN